MGGWMSAIAPTVVTLPCSGCTEDVVVDTAHFTVTATRPSNGRRGRLHRPAEVVTTDAWEDGLLVLWDCPLCEHADSWDPDA